MEIRQLKYFVGVVEAGSFTKAAARLNVAQSALSFHVRQLEVGFDTQLLVRDRTGVRLTAPGEKLLRHAKAILGQVQLANEELTKKIGSPMGEVTMGIPSGASRVLSGPLLEAVGGQYPEISLKITEGMTGQLEESMAAGRFNLAVLYRQAENVGGMTRLAREELCLVAPANQAPFTSTIALSDLHAFPLMLPMRNNNARRSVADVVAHQGCALDIRFEVDSLSTIVNFVAQGKGYSILSPSAVQNDLHDGRVKIVGIVDPLITRSVVLAVNRKDECTPTVLAVRGLTIKVAENLLATNAWPTTAR